LIKLSKYIIMSILILLSFYITNKTAILVRNEDPILSSIKEVSKEINTSSTNALIEGDYIIPGMYGSVVNELNSLAKMKEDNVFNHLYLDIDEVKPDISLEDNKDKIIKEGNQKKKAVAFVIPNNNTLKNYFINNNIKASVLTTLDTYSKDSFLEQINNDFTNYKSLDKLLTKNKMNTNICIVNENKEHCMNNKKYLVEYTIRLNKDIHTVKTNLKSGSIIYVEDITYLDTLVKYIYSKDLKVVYLSELINEKKTN